MNEKYTMKKWFLFITAILMLYSSVARAGDFDDATDAYEKGNYDQAIELFLPLATQGNANAQYNLGLMYDEGKGVTQDYQEAIKWYRLAAEQGHESAQSNLLAAQFFLGSMYYTGDGVTQDYKEALKWYRLAVEQGEAVAQYNLGLMYDEGKTVTQDYARAYMWFNLAASKGHKGAEEIREKVAKIMTPAQIAEAQKMARDCEKKNYKNYE